MVRTSSDMWTASAVKSFLDFFGELRYPPPEDGVQSATLGVHQPLTRSTRTLTVFDPSSLQHVLGSVTLDLSFVLDVVTRTSPRITSSDAFMWDYTIQPPHFDATADHETTYYDWVMWAVFYRAVCAVNAVRDELYHKASLPVPQNGYSTIVRVGKTAGGGAADCMHKWTAGSQNSHCTPHEFKRHRVLVIGQISVLDFLFDKAQAESGYQFLSNESVETLEGRGSAIISQVINEMINSHTGHAIICSQEQYAMVRLTSALQLEMSPVYSIHQSPDQASDLVTLVLFYTQAAIGAGCKYPRPQSTVVTTVMPVTLPALPISVFQPCEAIFRGGGIGRAKLLSMSKTPLFKLPWVRFDGDVKSNSNDVTIAYGHLIFLFVGSGIVVAKAAHEPSAAQRLVREHNAYAALRSLQGTVIPKVAGMFSTGDRKNVVLILSYTGKALTAFNELNPADKLKLFCRLVRLHKTGVQHNDLEPRNVTKSPSGPVIIDFDHASLDHQCPGTSCTELLQVAKALDLDAEKPEEPAATWCDTLIALMSFLVISLLGFGFFYYLYL